MSALLDHSPCPGSDALYATCTSVALAAQRSARQHHNGTQHLLCETLGLSSCGALHLPGSCVTHLVCACCLGSCEASHLPASSSCSCVAHLIPAQAAWAAVEAWLQLAQPHQDRLGADGKAAAPGTPDISPEERKRQKQRQRKVSCPLQAGRQYSHEMARGCAPGCMRGGRHPFVLLELQCLHAAVHVQPSAHSDLPHMCMPLRPITPCCRRRRSRRRRATSSRRQRSSSSSLPRTPMAPQLPRAHRQQRRTQTHRHVLLLSHQ